MKRRITIISITCAVLISGMILCHAQTDSNDSFIRENPELEFSAEPLTATIDYSKYPFLQLDSNKIELNGADWTNLRRLFASAADTVVTILHIGDSHIQAEGSTTRARSLLQDRYGSAGRGLIIPFKLAGTNEPRDYCITSDSRFATSKLLKQPWEGGMGFTGISLKPASSSFSFTISTYRRPGSEPDFELIRMFASGQLPVLVSALGPDCTQIDAEQVLEDGALAIYLDEPQTEVTLKFESYGDCQIYGFELSNQMTGVEYSAIGNNGATFTAYNNAGCIGQGISQLAPSLVILSMGTNEAFGKMSDFEMRNSIDKMVTEIRHAAPDATLLLTTPAECQRTKWVKTGKKKRRTRTYAINANVKAMRDAIKRYASDNDIACYDWYEVAGGDNCSSKWLNAGLLGNDRIHDTWDGYELTGNLLFEALVKTIENNENN